MTAGPTNRELLKRWQTGDQAAARILVDRYLVRLTALARARLSRRLARRLDAEDIVMSAWRSFFVASGRGRIDVPEDDNLWPVLVTLTLRKLGRQAARHQTQQRDFRRDESRGGGTEWMNAVADDPQPDQAAVLIDELQSLLSQLSPTDRKIVSRRLQGEEPTAIASACGCASRTVRRALQRFRGLANARQQADTPLTETRLTPTDGRISRSDSQPLPLPGEPSVAFDSLLLEEFIGFGGFSKLYRARDRLTGRTVAAKFLRKSFWHDERAIAALVQETRLVSKLSHPGIIQHFGWGRSPAGAVFIVMEWIDGPDLSHSLRERPLSLEGVYDCGLQVADALLSAHAVGIVHGDLTPSNVLVGPGGRVKLTDFGFAASLLDARQLPRGGTPGFLAPEQISEAFGPLTPRTDVYGFGGLLYALLTGRAPWAGDHLPDILAGILSSQSTIDVAQLRCDVPVSLAHLVMECLHKEPAARPESMELVDRRLRESQASRR